MPDVNCIACGAPVECVLDLGGVPLADDLFDSRKSSLEAIRYPLQVGHCSGCNWVQLIDVPDREVLFHQDYPYFSSVPEAVCRSAEAHAKSLITERSLNADSFVIEIASNDGYQLKWFREAGNRVLGIDPAPRQVAAAKALGINSRTAFFDEALADEIRHEHGLADVILAKNVLAHVTDPKDFLTGIRSLLHKDGIASIEFPYLGNLLSGGQFDTIYHEHASYIAIRPLDQLLKSCDLGIHRIREIDLHGGSIRIDLKRGFDPDNQFRKSWLSKEHASGINTGRAWSVFAGGVKQQIAALRTTMIEMRRNGLRVAAYGAAAKGVTLMNVCQLDYRDIEFLVDKNEFKVGKFMAGTGLEILSVETLMAFKPDVVLLLAWNHVKEIRKQQRGFEAGGGRFLLPIPQPELVERAG